MRQYVSHLDCRAAPWGPTLDCPATDTGGGPWWSIRFFASSEKSVGDVRFRQLSKCVIQRDSRDVEGAEAVGFSHGQFGLVVETLDQPLENGFLARK